MFLLGGTLITTTLLILAVNKYAAELAVDVAKSFAIVPKIWNMFVFRARLTKVIAENIPSAPFTLGISNGMKKQTHPTTAQIVTQLQSIATI